MWQIHLIWVPNLKNVTLYYAFRWVSFFIYTVPLTQFHFGKQNEMNELFLFKCGVA